MTGAKQGRQLLGEKRKKKYCLSFPKDFDMAREGREKNEKSWGRGGDTTDTFSRRGGGGIPVLGKEDTVVHLKGKGVEFLGGRAHWLSKEQGWPISGHPHVPRKGKGL